MTIYRYELTIPVRVVSALHSGGVDEVPERPITDEDDRTVQPNAFVRNGLGEAILPGRSIKGAIRAAFEEHMAELDFRKEELKSLWGGEMRQDVGTGKESLPLRASALTFHHAVVWDRASGDLPHRMSTAIDRATGGAADGALFAYEYLPVDTTFEIRVSADAQDPAPGSTKNKDAQSTAQREETKGTPPASLALVEKALDAVVTLIHSKLISLGGRTGAGWGRIELGHDEVRRVQVAIPAPVAKAGKPTNPIDQLLNPPRSKTLEETASSSSFLSASTSLEIEWQAPSGLFVGMNRPNDLRPSGEDTIAAAPLRNWHLDDKHRADHGDATYPKVAHEDKASLLLPGTSIRGALDSHKVCEARTDFARNILTSVISAFGEKCPEATSAEHTAINLIRKWAGSESDGIQVSSVSQRIRPTQVRISWYSPTGVFVHDPQSDDGNTQHPLRVKTAGKSTKDSTAPLLIPGTSIRGALRARCSRIARTVLYAKSGPPEEKSFVAADEKGNHRPIDIHEQLARDPNLVRYMFGTTEYRGAIRIKDCITTELGSYLKVTHNAIDRWTGGVVEGLLFNEVIYPHATWNDIVIEVDTARLLQNVKTESGIGGLSLDECLPFARASWCLLCIALAELSASTLSLGGRTTRGHGQVEVTSISVFGADGRVVNTPAEPILWKRNGSSEDDARGGATALLAYLRNKTEEQPSYEGWADHLQKLEDPTNEASDSNESNKQ